MKEMQKPLARYIDDEDLDRMLREQEREGDPMANFIKKNKAKENKHKKGETGLPGPQVAEERAVRGHYAAFHRGGSAGVPVGSLGSKQ